MGFIALVEFFRFEESVEGIVLNKNFTLYRSIKPVIVCIPRFCTVAIRQVIWDDIRVKYVKGQLPTPEGLYSASHCLCFGIPAAVNLCCNHWASGTVQFMNISPSPLLHRSRLCNVSCCASSLWPVLLIVPSNALHLLRDVQTHIHR